jgi:iron(III) transport system substrate-binding protein
MRPKFHMQYPLKTIIHTASMSTVLIAAALFIACGERDDETLTIYSGRSEDLIAPLLDRFAEETDTKVQVRYADSVELALLIREEGEQSPTDVFISQSPGPIAFLAELRLLRALSEDVLDLAPHSDGRQWVAITGRQRVLVYNRDQIAADDLPASIFELTEPQWEGRIGFAPSNGSFQDFVTLFRMDHGDDMALDWLQGLVANGAQTYGNNNAIVQAVARSEIDAGLVNHYYNERLKVENPNTPSANHRFADGDPGAVMIATAASALSSGDQELAEQFIRFLLEAESQRYFAEETLEYPLAAGVKPAAGIEAPATIDFGTFDALGGGLERTLELIREAGLDI